VHYLRDLRGLRSGGSQPPLVRDAGRFPTWDTVKFPRDARVLRLARRRQPGPGGLWRRRLMSREEGEHHRSTGRF